MVRKIKAKLGIGVDPNAPVDDVDAEAAALRDAPAADEVEVTF